MTRTPLSKKLRFDVFKRDSFVCQYCGAHPPSVILHVDHILPVAFGGENHIDNLITACEPCNLGKGAGLLSDVPKTMADRAAEVSEREDQLRAYNEILSEKAERLESQAWAVAAALEGKDSVVEFNRANLLSIKRFLELLPFQAVLDAADTTLARVPFISEKRQFRYFSGVCWNRIREEAQS